MTAVCLYPNQQRLTETQFVIVTLQALTYKSTVLQAHYPAVDRDKVKVVMSHMVQAGRLQAVPNHPSLVRMGGVVRQLQDQTALPRPLHDGNDHDDEMESEDRIVDDKASNRAQSRQLIVLHA